MVSLCAWVNRIARYKRGGGVEGGYNELVSGRGRFVSPAALAALSTGRRRKSAVLLACLFGACLIGGAGSFSAQAAQQSATCPDMLMDFECAEYLQRIAQAGNVAQRERIVNEYNLIVKERYRLCPAPRASERHAANFNDRSAP
jgi:hypothetical protein